MDPSDAKDAAKLISVPDVVGDTCKAIIASCVRGVVAGVQFDDFCKVSVCLYVYVCLSIWCV